MDGKADAGGHIPTENWLNQGLRFLATSCDLIDVWHTTYFHTLDNASSRAAASRTKLWLSRPIRMAR